MLFILLVDLYRSRLDLHLAPIYLLKIELVSKQTRSLFYEGNTKHYLSESHYMSQSQGNPLLYVLEYRLVVCTATMTLSHGEWRTGSARREWCLVSCLSSEYAG